MTISYNWLRDYLKTDLSAEELSVILTDIGLEVDKLEKTEPVKGGLQGVVVGEVLTCEKHPDADKLKVTSVNIGSSEPLQIVCGAPNVAAGQKVMVATVNTTLYPKGEDEGFKIKKSKIRGVESLGMLCAEDELGIGESHEGIMVLNPDIEPGTPGIDAVGIQTDYIIEIGLTPNRVDASSHYGVARDVAAYLKANGKACELSLPPVEDFTKDKDLDPVNVTVEDHEGAPRYAGLTIRGVKIGPSPEWMQNYLRAIGINPKNNVVDITNFVLHEIGQPLHAFDADKVDGGHVVVRTCPEGTKFTTLDEVERTLSSEDLMICSATKPMCIAGVFGGMESGVSDSTTNIFLESAYFNPIRVRKTARRHGLNTDSSFRFERGIDPDITIYGLKRAASLIKQYAGGSIVSDITDIYPEKIEPFRFDLSISYMNKLIGKNIPLETVKQIINALEISIENEQGDILSVAVPAYRVDVQRQADLIEDILRIYGYNNIEIPEHVNSTISYAPKPDKDKLTNLVADMLTANGFTEIMSNSLTKASYYEGLADYPAENCVQILNPLSNDLSVMRQTLVFNMLEAIQMNANRRNNDLKFYEIGNRYHFDAEKKSGENKLAPYSETYSLSIGITGLEHQPSWNVKTKQSDLFTLRAYVEKILKRFGLDINGLKSGDCTSDIFSYAMCYDINGKEFFRIGAVSTKLRSLFDIKQEVYFLEMDFGLLMKATRKHSVQAEELSKYPEVKRDLALLIDKNVTFSTLRQVAFAAERKLLKNVSLFDVYEGDKLPEGKKSYALSFILEDKTRTLTDNDIDRTMNNLITRFEKECGAEVRS